MNLAAQDDSIRERALSYVRQQLILRPPKPRLYSFHPGFRVKEPRIELRDRWQNAGLLEDAFCKFAKSVEEISKHARSKRSKYSSGESGA